MTKRARAACTGRSATGTGKIATPARDSGCGARNARQAEPVVTAGPVGSGDGAGLPPSFSHC